MPKQIAPFLMFTGAAEEAMTFYTSLFDDGRIVDITRFGTEGGGAEGGGTAGRVQFARFALAGQEFLCTDSPPVHDFSFTPSFSIWIETESDDEIQRLFSALAEGGSELMPLGEYGFSRRFGWLNDRFGVSWQLNLA
jgi:predicted 3-demethylubiquinone-9 3-methyltransferase (glyoxalase superfamily)